MTRAHWSQAATDHRIITPPAHHEIVPLTTPQRVVSLVPTNEVVSPSSRDPVMASPPADRVVAPSAPNRVVATAAKDMLACLRRTIDQIVTRAALDRHTPVSIRESLSNWCRTIREGMPNRQRIVAPTTYHQDGSHRDFGRTFQRTIELGESRSLL